MNSRTLTRSKNPARGAVYLSDLDDVRLRVAHNCAAVYRSMARGMGKPWRLWDDLRVCDLGLPVSLPPNSGHLLRPLDEDRVEDVLARLHGFFAANLGGGYELWSIWPTSDLAAYGFERVPSPGMVRLAGGKAPPLPPELEVVEALDAATVREIDEVLIPGFDMPLRPEELFDERMLGEPRYRMWLGRVEGRPVSTAAAYVSDGFVGVYAVATTPEARRRGYGEAVTWAATLCVPDLPATLQASDMGQPVYERMGYRTVVEFTVWEKPTRA